MAAAKRRGPVRKFFGTLGRAFAILIFIGIITGSIVVSVMALYIFDSLEGAPVVDLSNVEVNLNNTSYIYVTDPETQEETIVKELYSGQNREWVSYDQIPEMLVNVTIAAEDKRFLEHHGVDWLRTIRSTLGYFGGSPCTGRLHHHTAGHQEPDRQRRGHPGAKGAGNLHRSQAGEKLQ